jgi:large subunit ribosomal protein L3
MISTVFGIKLGSSRHFTENGVNIPVTHIMVEKAVVTEIVQNENTQAYMLAVGTKKQITKPIAGQMKKAGLDIQPRFLRKVDVSALDETITVGKEIKAEEVFSVGDAVQITGVSKGKGFAGVVKRHGFAGGPKTHGQGDHWRSPGSIGSGTTPGRVQRGLRMAGRMGGDKVTIKGLSIVAINTDTQVISVKGLIPGAKQSTVTITKA